MKTSGKRKVPIFLSFDFFIVMRIGPPGLAFRGPMSNHNVHCRISVESVATFLVLFFAQFWPCSMYIIRRLWTTRPICQSKFCSCLGKTSSVCKFKYKIDKPRSSSHRIGLKILPWTHSIWSIIRVLVNFSRGGIECRWCACLLAGAQKEDWAIFELETLAIGKLLLLAVCCCCCCFCCSNNWFL